MHAQSHQSYPTLYDPIDYSPRGSSVHGTLQERILEQVAMPSPRDLLKPRTEPAPLLSPALQVDSLPLSHRGSPIERGALDDQVVTVEL